MVEAGAKSDCLSPSFKELLEQLGKAHEREVEEVRRVCLLEGASPKAAAKRPAFQQQPSKSDILASTVELGETKEFRLHKLYRDKLTVSNPFTEARMQARIQKLQKKHAHPHVHHHEHRQQQHGKKKQKSLHKGGL